MTDVCIVMLGVMMECVNFRNVANKDDVHINPGPTLHS